MWPVGVAASGSVSPEVGDKRFRDPAYDNNPWYFWLEQQYLLAGQLASELLDAAHLKGMTDVKARLAAIENRHKVNDANNPNKPTLRRTSKDTTKDGDKKDDDRPTLKRRN